MDEPGPDRRQPGLQTITIRDARSEDAVAVAGVHVRSWQVAYRGLLPDDYLDALQASDRAARYTFGDRRPDRPATIVAITDEAVRGFATTGPSRDDDGSSAGELYSIYVDPGSWGRGIGRALIAEARSRLSEQGFTEAVLWVLAGNEHAMRFYRADGWQPDGDTRKDVIWGVSVDEVRYRRRLP
jgi:ribosomal protein S18 acetylase RimI-like enzyme